MSSARHVNPKPVIVMQPGPLHLFWTTGIFYFWLLKERFDFVLIVPEAYRDNPQFAKVASLEAIRHVEYLPSKGRLLRHFRYSNRFQKLLKQYLPAYILLHNHSYVENLYLIYWSRKICPETPRYFYQNGRMSLMWQNDFAARRAGQIEALTKKISFLSRNLWVAGRIVDTRNALNFTLNYKVLPWLAIRAIFCPPVNVMNGSINREAARRMSSNDKDFLLAYLDNEIEAYRAMGIDNIIQISHPMSVCGSPVFRFLYGEVVETDTILLLPSYGFTSIMMIEEGWKQTDLVQHIAGKWCGAIENLLERFPGFAVSMKLHPASYADPVWHEIILLIQSRFPALNVIEPNQSAEWHVVQSRVIVGDVTTLLWWAGMHGGKVVISLNIFGYPGGDELEKYPTIISYVTDCIDWPELLQHLPRAYGQFTEFPFFE